MRKAEQIDGKDQRMGKAGFQWSRDPEHGANRRIACSWQEQLLEDGSKPY